MTHICLEVSDIEQLTQRLRAAGFQSRSTALVTIPRGAYQGLKCIYFLDLPHPHASTTCPPVGPPVRPDSRAVRSFPSPFLVSPC
jgi:hypothetical protein